MGLLNNEDRRQTVLERIGYTSLFVLERHFNPHVILIKLRLGLNLYMSQDAATALMQFMRQNDIPRYDYSFSFTSRPNFVKVTQKKVA